MQGSHISLFAGVGMTDIAAESLGFKTVATAEVDPFCRSVLEARFPDATHLDDVRDVSYGGTPLPVGVDWRPLLVSGGFPCQDVSSLGAGAGVEAGARSGLWAEFARVIREFRPEYVLIENSPLLRKRGLDVVLRDLWRMGYSAKWDCVPAAAVGAPHLRDRIFIVAKPEPTPDYQGGTCRFLGVDPTGLPRAGTMKFGEVREATPQHPVRDCKAAAHWPTPRRAPNEWRTTRNAPSHGRTHGKTLAGEVNDRERALGRIVGRPSESAGNMNPEWVEWLMGLPQGWTDPSVSNPLPHAGWASEPGCARTLSDAPSRRGRLQALGNGLVPAAAVQAFKVLS